MSVLWISAANGPRGMQQQPGDRVLSSGLADLGWTIHLFDWREPLPASMATASDTDGQLILHRYLGSMRDIRIGTLVEYLAGLREHQYTVINSLNAFEFGRRKHYLLSLQSSGIPTIPTTLAPVLATLDELRSIGEPFGSDIVVKPIDGELSQDVMRLGHLDEVAVARLRRNTRALLVQPFLPGVRSGEISLVAVVRDGKLFPVYSLRKVPPDWIAKGSSSQVSEISMDEAHLQLLHNSFAAWPTEHRPVAAIVRADIITDSGINYLSELEVVNPGVGLEHASPESQRAFVLEVHTMLSSSLLAGRHQPQSMAGGSRPLPSTSGALWTEEPRNLDPLI